MGVLSRPVDERGDFSKGGDAPSVRQQRWRSQRVAELSSGIAHEVRNPLNAMAIHLEVLSDKLRDVGGNLPGTVRPNLDAIRGQIHRLDGIIRLFSDFAQGRAPSRELRDIIDGAVTLCSFPMRRMGLEVELSPLPSRVVRDGAAASLALVETLLLGVECAPVGAKFRISVSGEKNFIHICFESNTPLGEVDQKRLELVGSLLEEQGGRLETGGQPGIVAVLSVPVEVSST